MVDAEFFYKELAKKDVISRQGFAQRNNDQLNLKASLNIYSRASSFCKIGLWCSIGHSCKDTHTIEKLMSAGMNVACVNVTFGSREYNAEIIRGIREAETSFVSKAAGIEHFLAIAIETRGPEIRSGALDGNKEYPLVKGDSLKLTTDKAYIVKSSNIAVYIDYEDLTNRVQPDDRIYICDGAVILTVTAIHGSNIITTIENDGVLKSRRSVFLPNCRMQLPSLTEDDKANIKFGIHLGVHYILAGRIRNAADVMAIRELIGTSKIKIIAKIESFEATQNINKIMEVADGIFINRFYIGVEIPNEKVFIAQKSIISKCNAKNIPVIAAKEFLESMKNKRRPLQSECGDVANAVIDGVDGIYIHETAGGLYPTECVEVTASICRESESASNQWAHFREMASLLKNTTLTQSIAVASVQAAYKVNAAAIIAFSITGSTVKVLVNFRPHCPILVLLQNEYLGRQMSAYRGVFPILYMDTNDKFTPQEDWMKFIEARVEYGILHGKILGIIRSGDPIVIVHGSSPTVSLTDVMRIIYVSDVVKPIAY